jgi:streptomycin 6-kinase
MSEHTPHERLTDLAARWQVEVAEVRETASSLLAFGMRRDAPVVLKIVKTRNDEWNSGAMLEALSGPTVVRVLQHQPGAVLLDRALPGTSLVDLVLGGRDDEATRILADVISRTPAVEPPAATPTVEVWGSAFDWYVAYGEEQIPGAIAEEARGLFRRLCATQNARRLLHGDLQHSNVVYDDARGWIVIDAKGVSAELEFEIGAALRNPAEAPEFVINLETVERRLNVLCEALRLDRERVAAWAFAQAVLSAIWSVQDGEPLAADCAVLRLAAVLRPLVTHRS